MASVSITELKAHLAEYLRHVQDGERFHITSRGREVADLVPADPVRAALWRMVEDGEASGAAGSRSCPATSPSTPARSSPTSCSRIAVRTGTTRSPTRSDPVRGHERCGQGPSARDRQRTGRRLVRASRAGGLQRHHLRGGVRRARQKRPAAGTRSDALRTQLAALDTQWDEFLVLPVAGRAAGRAALAHGLRGMDAVQLSAAVTLRAAAHSAHSGRRSRLRTFDRRLLKAAEREGFATLGGPLE